MMYCAKWRKQMGDPENIENKEGEPVKEADAAPVIEGAPQPVVVEEREAEADAEAEAEEPKVA
jgi:hypothetical protein